MQTKIVNAFQDFLAQFGSPRFEEVGLEEIRFRFDDYYVDVATSITKEESSLRIYLGSIPFLCRTIERSRVDLLRFFHKAHPDDGYEERFRFKDELELVSALPNVLEEFLETDLRPILSDPEKLKSIVHVGLRSEMIDEHNASINRQRAIEAFRQRDFDAAVRNLSKIDPYRLSITERKKLEYARKRSRN